MGDTANTTLVDDQVDLLAFVSSTSVNFLIGVLLFFAFCVLRTRFHFYAARSALDESVLVPEVGGFLSWLKPIVRVNEETIFQNSGLDALIYVKFFNRAFKLCMFGSLVGVTLLVVNVYGGHGEFGFGAIAVSNVTEGSHLLVSHLIGVYVFTLLCFYILKLTYADYSVLRHRHLSELQPTTARSVLITCLPPFCRTQPALEDFFRRVYGRQFHSAAIAPYSKHRAELAKRRLHALEKLENALAAFAHTGERPRDKVKGFCRNTETLLLADEEDSVDGVDSIRYWSHRVEMLNEDIASSRIPDSATAGFVTFTTLRAAHEATRVQLDGTPNSFKCRLAPEMRDVCWENLHKSHKQKRFRGLLAIAMVAGLILFSTVPITAISAVTTLPNLVKYLPSQIGNAILSSDALSGFLSGFLPSLANIIFLALLPNMLTKIAKFEGLESFSWIERRMARYFFIFAVFTFFIAQTLASSLLSELAEIRTANDVIRLLAHSIPKFGYFFCIFILMRAFVSLFLSLLDPTTLVVSSMAYKFAKTERAIQRAELPPPISFGVEYSNHLLVFVITVSYAIIQPIILIFASIYFALGFMVAKYKVLFIAVAKYESGGQYWPDMFTHMCLGLFVSQLTLIGVFGLKQVPIETACVTPLPFITLAFWWWVRDEFKLLSESLPIDQMLVENSPSLLPATNTYLCPAMDPIPIRVPTPEDTRKVEKNGITYYAFGPPEPQKLFLTKSQ